ncbi:MAG: CHC2 zinc finger domain-containing protein [Thermomicrobiales bacterium]
MQSTRSAVETKPPERFSRTKPPVPRKSHIYDDAWADFRRCDSLVLASAIESLRFCVADPIDPVDEFIQSERLRAARDVEAVRSRAFAAGRDVPDPHAPDQQPWSDLAARLKSLPLMRDVYETSGLSVAQEGRTELHGRCPGCGGANRFVIFLGPHERFWCRQCTAGGDVIALTMTVLGATFREAVAHLAARAGLALPPGRAVPERSQTASRFLPVRTGGGRRGG